MIMDTSDREDSTLEKVANEDGTVLLPALLAIGLTLEVWSGNIDLSELWLVIAIFISTVILDIWRYHAKSKYVKYARIGVLTGYHLVLAVTFLVVMPMTYPYIFLGLMPVFIAFLWYGKRGALISSLFQVIIMSLSYIVFFPDATFSTFASFMSVVVVAIILFAFIVDVLDLAQSRIDLLVESSGKLELEHKRLNSIINSMGDGVVATDDEGKIVNYNGAALELLNTNETISGKHLMKYLDLTDRDGKPVDIIKDVKKLNRTIIRDDLILILGKDDKLNLYINIAPIHLGYESDASRSAGFTLIMRDITAQKSLEEERDEFISVVSHELRTPIAITEGKISNSLLTNKNNSNDKKVAQSLSEAHEQVVFLSAMINDLSTLARAERGSLDMEISLIDPTELMKDVQSDYQAEAKQRKLKLTVHTAKDLPSINNSKLYIQEILQNFVTNSLKYTHKGSIEIRAEKGSKKGEVRFSVKDTGIGISTSDKKHLFEKFFRSEDYRTRESGGTGLGLHITKKLSDKIGGKITIKSTLNKGSTFCLTVGSLDLK